ncbi:MAG: dimethylsulfoniopropionate demethylase [Halofilum sp. (in: g-proteobacteria)]|nr:dimethylsulfoniopropionate demethylase [Halofilum sp. (in: g-proteobacteria)]
MTAPLLSVSRRTRRTPFTDRVEAAGVRAYTVYNHMLLPTVFESLEADAAHLKRHVQVWDVSCQRQVQVDGPDARYLLQLCTPRDLGRLGPGQCRYAPLVDVDGGMLNDPVILQIDARRYWVSIADHDIRLWLAGIAAGMGLRVTVDEPDVNPLAVQGPQAETLVRRVFGEAVHDIRFFRYEQLAFAGRSLVVSRSGYSRQGGFEIYVEGADIAGPLWDALMEAGADLGVRAGGPNLIERIEGGLLSYGNDMTRADTPYECGAGPVCRLDTEPRCLAAEALREEARHGPRRHIRGLRIDGAPVPSCDRAWEVLTDGEPCGQVTSAVWSPERATNVAIGMIEAGRWAAGTRVTLDAPDGPRDATVCDLPHA